MRVRSRVCAVAVLVFGVSLVVPEGARAGGGRAVTVVAIVDGGGFSPYVYEFVGHQHPWNKDTDPTNNFLFTDDPSTYVAGYPGGTSIPLTIPTNPDQRVDAWRTGRDAAKWDLFQASTFDEPHMYWFPGTKIVGALRFQGDFYGSNSAHGTRSAVSAAGNTLGTCPECVVVLVQGSGPEALKWAASQPWIDVVTNSYGHGLYTQNDPARFDPTGRVPGAVVRDNVYPASPIEVTKAASDAGQVITFSAGNGFANAYDVPPLTWWSSEKGPDWMVTVGAISPFSRSTTSGSGKPVDISSIGDAYPSTGGNTAAGTGTHSGTSNASPVVGGYFAKVIQRSRELAADTIGGHAGGAMVSGTPVACGAAHPSCPLGDGVLTRLELQDLVFHNALPAESVVAVDAYPTIPATPVAYAYQGHGALFGRQYGASTYDGEWRRMVETATGDRLPPTRPPGERAWFVGDSLCRQKLWGSWSWGYWRGADPVFDPASDAPGAALWAACTALPPETIAGLRKPVA